MTNKLPEVGKRYKITEGGLFDTCLYDDKISQVTGIRLEHNKFGENILIIDFQLDEKCLELTAESFLDNFEKLPEDNSIIKGNSNLQNALSEDGSLVANFHRKAKNLLNALDDTRTQAEPVVDNKMETKLPWKDISELPEIYKIDAKEFSIIMRDNKQFFMPEVEND